MDQGKGFTLPPTDRFRALAVAQPATAENGAPSVLIRPPCAHAANWICHCQTCGEFLSCSHRMWTLLKEFLKFSKQEKKWWLIPLVVVLLLLGAVLIFTASSGIAWALYPFL